MSQRFTVPCVVSALVLAIVTGGILVNLVLNSHLLFVEEHANREVGTPIHSRDSIGSPPAQQTTFATKRVLAPTQIPRFSSAAEGHHHDSDDAQRHSIPRQMMHVYFGSDGDSSSRNETAVATYRFGGGILVSNAATAARINSVVRMNPDYDHYFFDEAAAIVFVEDHFSLRHSEALDELASVADKESLFRLLWLQAVGGVAIDHRLQVRVPFRYCIKETTSLLVGGDPLSASLSKKPSSGDSGMLGGKIEVGILASPPWHSVISVVVERTLVAVTTRDARLCKTCLLGEVAFARALRLVYDRRPDPTCVFLRVSTKWRKTPTKGMLIEVRTRNEKSKGKKTHTTKSKQADETVLVARRFIPAAAPVLLIPHHHAMGLYKPLFPDEVSPTSDDSQPLLEQSVADNDVKSTAACRSGISIDFDLKTVTVAPQRKRLVHVPQLTQSALTFTARKIPQKILQLSFRADVPRGIWRAMETLVDLNPEYEYHYYSDASIRAYLTAHFDDRTVRAFDSLIPGAFKADLFRYCWLLREGGVYVDIDFVAVRPLREVIRVEDTFLSAEDNGTGGIYNAILASIANHPLIRNILESALRRIENQRYGSDTLAVTGPSLGAEVFKRMTRTVAQPGQQGTFALLPVNFRFLSFNANDLGTRCLIGQITDQTYENMRDAEGRDRFFWANFRGYRPEMRWYARSSKHYHAIWKERAMYNVTETQFDRYAKRTNILSPSFSNSFTLVNVGTSDGHLGPMQIGLVIDRDVTTGFAVVPPDVIHLVFDKQGMFLARPPTGNGTQVDDTSTPVLSCLRVIPRPNSTALQDSVYNPEVQLIDEKGELLFKHHANEELADPVAFYDYRNVGKRAAGKRVREVYIHKKKTPSLDPMEVGELEFLSGPDCTTVINLGFPVLAATRKLEDRFFALMHPARRWTCRKAQLPVEWNGTAVTTMCVPRDLLQLRQSIKAEATTTSPAVKSGMESANTTNSDVGESSDSAPKVNHNRCNVAAMGTAHFAPTYTSIADKFGCHVYVYSDSPSQHEAQVTHPNVTIIPVEVIEALQLDVKDGNSVEKIVAHMRDSFGAVPVDTLFISRNIFTWENLAAQLLPVVRGGFVRQVVIKSAYVEKPDIVRQSNFYDAKQFLAMWESRSEKLNFGAAGETLGPRPAVPPLDASLEEAEAVLADWEQLMQLVDVVASSANAILLGAARWANGAEKCSLEGVPYRCQYDVNLVTKGWR